ncbi:glutamyl-tRNA synthetase [Mollisia scopiformis]|uniref:Glutamate--tRNA ligase, mitochondrial n=1 Tax=Mollisia scopiformis TaxID=149040 RepID=A0A194XQ06_MOLSC|nr:glutamyl-tRNA synthetase [Mollisia scopiformis]KUJ22139.1 glutamyl-tRNA synthetase [Mollisia scopiformis]
MQLLLATARRRVASGWICHSCRGIKEATRAAKQLRQNKPARTRFAPSPTGYLHLGSLRTALFNYLVAKATGGQFLLRIEDTDQKRTVPDAETRLFEDLEWAGIEWDEGPKIGGPHGPYKQSARTALYREHAELLLQNGSAYRCFCTPERLHELGNYRSKLGLPVDYDRACAHIHKAESDDRAAKGEAHVVRLKVPELYPVFNDLVYGLVRQASFLTTKRRVQGSALGSFDDPILLKSDGFPTYHLANVVDDHHMKITHVIRGSEWMSSTPKHLAMYQAFGWEPPAFAHVGLLLDKDRNKLSKRHGAIDISTWRDKGVFPEALNNFVALLGWSHNEKQDVMTMEQLIENASMKYTRGDSVVSFEKLWFLQRKHAALYASMPPRLPMNPRHSLTELAVQPMVKLLDHRSSFEDLSLYTTTPQGEARENYVRSILLADAPNYTTPTEFIARNIYFFVRPSAKKLREKIPSLKLHKVPPSINYPVSTETLALFKNVSLIPDADWNGQSIKNMSTFVVDRGVTMSLASSKTGKLDERMRPLVQKAWSTLVHGYLRWAIFGGNQGPDGGETMRILGKVETVRRLEKAEKVVLRAREIEERDKGGLGNDGVPIMAKLDGMEQSESKEKETVKQQQVYLDDWSDLDDDSFI